LTQLVEKLADGNARLRDGARKGLDQLAAAPSVGPSVVAHHLIKPLPPKHKSNWRPIASRLEILAHLVNTYGIGPASGLNLENLLSFPKATQAYSHSHGEVRDAAKDLVVGIQRIVGTPPLEPTLSLLRKKQREEYEAAFEGKQQVKSKEVDEKSSSPHKRTDMSHQHATHNPGGKVPTSSARANNQAQGYSSNNSPTKQKESNSEFSSCMFCGVQNSSWSENDLDLHYWKDCPLLISCPSCAQIVEIAGLPEHLLDECDHKTNYVPCDTTGKRERVYFLTFLTIDLIQV
jgi:centrosomal protein CEP104